MSKEQELISALEELVKYSELYYKWCNQYDLRVDDLKLRGAISKAKSVLNKEHVG